jgi:hypothetical protein
VKNAFKAGEAAVLMRVSEVSLRHNETEETFLENVTRYNNTQNAVKVSDFRSNDHVWTTWLSKLLVGDQS